MRNYFSTSIKKLLIECLLWNTCERTGRSNGALLGRKTVGVVRKYVNYSKWNCLKTVFYYDYLFFCYSFKKNETNCKKKYSFFLFQTKFEWNFQWNLRSFWFVFEVKQFISICLWVSNFLCTWLSSDASWQRIQLQKQCHVWTSDSYTSYRLTLESQTLKNKSYFEVQ